MSNQLDKPVDTILEDYNAVNVKLIQNQSSLVMSACKLWRMNLCAVSDEIPCTFYVAMNYRIKVYELDTINSPFKDPIKTIASPTAVELGAGAESPFVINAIKVGKMLEKEVLVSVSESGEICIWRTENLDAPPFILNNQAATWGIAIHGEQGLLSVSANSYKVTVYNILEMTRDNPIFGKRRVDEPNHLQSLETISLVGHEHNIPNIDFDASGRYIASASIDSTCKVWDITTGKVVTERRRTPHFTEPEPQDGWCWSTKFITPGCFKYAVCTDKKVTKTFLHRLDAGRSTSLSSMGLCHSATNPAFPMNISRIFDMVQEDVDFEIYEGEGEGELDDTRWDEALLDQENDYMEEVYERQRQEDDYNYNNGIPFIQARSDTENLSGIDEVSSSSFEQSLPLRYEQPERAVVGDTPNIGWTIINTEAGWEDTSNTRPTQWRDRESFDSESEEEEEVSEPEEQPSIDKSAPSYCIPNIIRTESSSSLKIEQPKPTKKKKKNSMGQYLMFTTGKDVYLAGTTIPTMQRIRVEHNIISKVDVRTDPLLKALERINMVEWLPELELFVAASQNGTVALMRIIQIDFDGEKQACIFNCEHYLPHDVLQSTPLYGMTVKKVEIDRFTPVSYQIFLFYYSGNVMGYNISRNDSNITMDNIVF